MLQVHTSGLFAAAQRLRAAAVHLAADGVTVHPPLADDHTSVAAAARLSTAAAQLHAAVSAHSRALCATADQLVAVATRFADQEALNSAGLQMFSSVNEPVGSPAVIEPLPETPADNRPALAPAVLVDGETVARQLWAGNASAGSDFAQKWRARAAAAHATAGVVREVVSVLPELWRGPAGTTAVTARLLRQAREIEMLAERARALAGQATDHARSFTGAVEATPAPVEFEAVRNRLRQAVEANSRSGGQYSPLLATLVSQRGALNQRAVKAHSDYRAATEAATRPDQAAQLAGQLPAMVPGMLGALGTMVGGAVAAAAQLPQALLQTGQQLAQAATQGLSGLAGPAAGTAANTRQFESSRHAPQDSSEPATVGATTAAGATEIAPVLPSTSLAPPSATPLPAGAPPPAAAPTAGVTPLPLGMPVGMLGAPGAADATKPVAADKTLVVPMPPHTESLTGKAAAVRLAGVTRAKARVKAEVP